MTTFRRRVENPVSLFPSGSPTAFLKASFSDPGVHRDLPISLSLCPRVEGTVRLLRILSESLSLPACRTFCSLALTSRPWECGDGPASPPRFRDRLLRMMRTYADVLRLASRCRANHDSPARSRGDSLRRAMPAIGELTSPHRESNFLHSADLSVRRGRRPINRRRKTLMATASRTSRSPITVSMPTALLVP